MQPGCPARCDLVLAGEPLSPQPEGLEDALTYQAIADVIGYLPAGL